MPVPIENIAQQRRPQLNSRACSYQDTSRYRAAGTVAPPLSQTNTSQQTQHKGEDANKANAVGELPAVSENGPEQGDANLAGLVGSSNPGIDNGPLRTVVERPSLTRTFTREAWVKQMTSGVSATPKQSPSVYGPRQSPFIPGGHYNPSVSGASTPAGDLGITTSSVWGPASPSLTGTFNVASDLPSSANNEAEGKQTFAFTVHAERNLSAHSRPGTPVNDAGDRVPESVAETVERHREGQEVVDATPLTGRKVMVAVDAADQDGLNTLAYACDKVVGSGDVLYVVRVVRELRGFKGSYSAAAEMLRSIELRARGEAELVTCQAIRELGKAGKKAVDVYVTYRVGDPRACIRELVGKEAPQILVVGNNRKRVASGSVSKAAGRGIFFHGGQDTFVPHGMQGVEIISIQ